MKGFVFNNKMFWHRFILDDFSTPIWTNSFLQDRCKAAPSVGESATVREWQRGRLGWQGTVRTVGTRAKGQADWSSLPCVPALQPEEACASVTPTGQEHTTNKHKKGRQKNECILILVNRKQTSLQQPLVSQMVEIHAKPSSCRAKPKLWRALYKVKPQYIFSLLLYPLCTIYDSKASIHTPWEQHD